MESEGYRGEDGWPDWLAHVPVPAENRHFSELDEGHSVPTEMLAMALDVPVDSEVGSFTVDPSLARDVAQFTERPGWRQFPSVPTFVKRVGENAWIARIGEREFPMNADTLRGYVERAAQQRAERGAASVEGAASFLELEQKEQVTAGELIASLRNYAAAGAAVLGPVVIAQLERATFTESELLQVGAAASHGIDKQAAMQASAETIRRERDHYEQIFLYAMRRLLAN